MNRDYLSDALGGVSDRHIVTAYHHKGRRTHFLFRSAAAVLAAVLLAGGVMLFTRDSGLAVSVCAAGSDRELTRAGESFVTGRVSDTGELTGHPLMFYVTGENIATVRLSARNESLRFTDLTEQRDEFGTAANVTVPYGDNESEYSFLIYDWVPLKLLSALRSGQYAAVSAVPAELRRDEIALEVTFQNGKTLMKSVRVELLDDGTFFASSGDFEPGEDDSFLRRPDAQVIPRDAMYGQGLIQVEVRPREGRGQDSSGAWAAEDIDSLLVTWQGREPDMVQMFAEAGGEMELLMTREIDSAEGSAAFPGLALEGTPEGEVWFVITFDSQHIVTSDRLRITSGTYGPVENGQFLAYIRDLTGDTLTFDRIEWVEVPSQRAEDLGITEDDAPSGFLLYNSADREETLETAADCELIALDWEDSFRPRPLDRHGFLDLLEARAGRETPWTLTVENGVVVRIEEKYVP